MLAHQKTLAWLSELEQVLGAGEYSARAAGLKAGSTGIIARSSQASSFVPAQHKPEFSGAFAHSHGT